jgi:hypothetical protein
MAQEDREGTVLQVLDEGIIGEHPPKPDQLFLASPAIDQTFNVLELDIVPIACLNLGDILFEFDSSFVRPDAAKILGGLGDLRESRKNSKGDLPPLSIFGHADPEGTIEYNKQLSGRRARAVYGVLINDPSVWDFLYKNPFGGDNWQQNSSVKGLAASLGLPADTARRDAFQAYMQVLCPTPVTPADFLGQGAGPDGKADFQGCSKFNPLILLSKEDNQDLTEQQRREANLLNRRVVVYLFRPGLKVTSSLWPCPTASQPADGCKKRLFLDADERMKPGDERREHTKASDKTFACRFYDRIGGPSPCERVLQLYRIRLFDKAANPLPAAPYFITDGKTKFLSRARADAFADLRDIKVPATVQVKWSRPQPDDTPLSPAPKETDSFEFQTKVFVDLDDTERQQASVARLHNLAYDNGPTQEDDVKAFQKDYQDRFGLTVSGMLDDATQDALEQVNNDCDPSVKQLPGGSAQSG